MKNKIIILFLFLLSSLASHSQSGSSIEDIRQQRLRKIDYYHLSFAFSAGGNVNHFAGIQLSAGFGSFRNFINADFGLRYNVMNPISYSDDERLSVHLLPLFVSMQINVFSFNNNSIFLGTELEYAISLQTRHHYPDGNHYDTDNKAGNNHFTLSGKIGAKIVNWEIYIKANYLLGPAFNQKYIFESTNYDYMLLKESLFERWQIGLAVVYHFNL
jgi:hypothetical protein